MSALRKFASEAACGLYDDITAVHEPEQLEHLARTLWRKYGEGVVGDDDAQFLDSYIRSRRPLGRSSSKGHLRTMSGTKLAGRFGSRFKPRQRPRSPDRRASRDRRRTLAGSATLPPNLRHHYTEGQRAVLTIIAGEVKHHGICDLCIDKIGALAGVCHTTVQTTLHEARRLGHVEITERPRPGQKHLTNVITVISREWRTWLERGPSAHRPIGSNSLKIVSTTKITTIRKKEAIEERTKHRDRSPPCPNWQSIGDNPMTLRHGIHTIAGPWCKGNAGNSTPTTFLDAADSRTKV